MNGRTQGFIAAPVTAYHPDGNVNFDIIPAYVAFLHSNGVVGAFINGTTGEGLSLTVEERMTGAERWVEAAPHDFKVIVHVAHTSTVSACRMARHAANIHASAIADMGPLYYKLENVRDLADHAAQTAAQAPDLPYYYYHMPSMNAVCFPMIDLLRTAEPMIPNLAGIKYTHEDLVDLELCSQFNEGKYDILYGRDETLICALALGCRGAVGSTYNIMAPLYARLIDDFNSGNLHQARRLQHISMKVICLLAGTKKFISALKLVMKMIGLDPGGVRSPLKNIEPAKIAALKKDLNELGFFEFCSKLPPL